MREKWFCRKKGIICPHASVTDQVRNCAEEKKAERERLDFLKAEHPEMLRQKPQPVIMGKDGNIDAKQTAILQRVELMQRQAAAAERIAAALEKIANALGKGGNE